MKLQELNRTTAPGEVRSSYIIGNLTLNLTSRFNDKIALEDAMYQIVLQRLRSQKKSEERQNEDGNFDRKMV